MADPLDKYFQVEPGFQQGQPPVMDIPNYGGGVFYDDQTGQTIPMSPEEQAMYEEMKASPMGNLTPEQLIFAEQIRKRGQEVPQAAPQAQVAPNPLEPYLAKTSKTISNSEQMLPVSDDDVIKSLMQQYGDQAKEAINLQKSGVTSLEENLRNMKQQEPQYDLSPLAGLVDTWTGSELGKYYQRPESVQARNQRLLDLELKLQHARQGLSEEQRKLMGEQLGAYLKTRKDPLTQAVKMAQIDWYKANAGKPAQQQAKEQQNLREDVLKTKESQAIQAGLQLKDSLNTYKNLVQRHGVQISGPERLALDTAYADLKIKYKEAAKLGALTGPDMEIIMEAIVPSTGIKGAAKSALGGGREGMIQAIDQMHSRVDRDTAVLLNALESTFPKDVPVIKEYRNKLYKNQMEKQKRLEELRKKQSQGE